MIPPNPVGNVEVRKLYPEYPGLFEKLCCPLPESDTAEREDEVIMPPGMGVLADVNTAVPLGTGDSLAGMVEAV